MGVLGSMAACSAPPPERERIGAEDDAIINGTVDLLHSAVVAYLHDGSKCSATMIMVKGNVGWALTAGHCIGQSLGQINVGTDHNNPAAVYPVVAKATHFGYPASPLYDFGMLKFTGATGGTVTTPAIPANLDNIKVGTSLDAVGFGLTQDGGGDTSVRHHRTMQVKTVTELRFTFDQAAGGICQGDSGGPSTYTPGTEYVASVHSSVTPKGNVQTCLFEGNDVRVAPVVDTFINPYINGTAYGKQTCAQCSEAHYAGICLPQIKNCFGNADCAAYDSCIQGCQANACVVDCKNKHMGGAALHAQIFSCICTSACPQECGKATFCNQPKCGLTSGKAGCQACFEGGCCAESQACSQSNTCLSCFNSVIPPLSCKSDPTTQAFTQCLASKCSQSCGASSSSSTAAASSSATTTAATAGAGGAEVGVTSSGDSSGSTGGSGGAATTPTYTVSDCSFHAREAEGRTAALVLLAALALTSTRRARSSTRRRAARNRAA